MELSHINEEGHARMVDITNKPAQLRTAVAKGFIRLEPETVRLVRENEIKKGDVLTISEFAGIQAAKQTSALIPLCHPLQLTRISVKCSLTDIGVEVTAKAKCTGQTGVEMEALTAVSVALLTVYDMCKAVDREMEIGGIRLIQKTKE